MNDSIMRSVDIHAPVERVWKALTDHREFGQWFKVALDQPFEPGGKSTGMMTYPGFEHVPWTAEIVAIEPMTRFAFRWPQTDENDTVREDWDWMQVEFRVEALGEDGGNGTRVTVTESGFDRLPDYRRADALRQNTGGWEEQMRNIKAHVEG